MMSSSAQAEPQFVPRAAYKPLATPPLDQVEQGQPTTAALNQGQAQPAKHPNFLQGMKGSMKHFVQKCKDKRERRHHPKAPQPAAAPQPPPQPAENLPAKANEPPQAPPSAVEQPLPQSQPQPAPDHPPAKPSSQVASQELPMEGKASHAGNDRPHSPLEPRGRNEAGHGRRYSDSYRDEHDDLDWERYRSARDREASEWGVDRYRQRRYRDDWREDYYDCEEDYSEYSDDEYYTVPYRPCSSQGRRFMERDIRGLPKPPPRPAKVDVTLYQRPSMEDGPSMSYRPAASDYNAYMDVGYGAAPPAPTMGYHPAPVQPLGYTPAPAPAAYGAPPPQWGRAAEAMALPQQLPVQYAPQMQHPASYKTSGWGPDAFAPAPNSYEHPYDSSRLGYGDAAPMMMNSFDPSWGADAALAQRRRSLPML